MGSSSSSSSLLLLELSLPEPSPPSSCRFRFWPSSLSSRSDRAVAAPIASLLPSRGCVSLSVMVWCAPAIVRAAVTRKQYSTDFYVCTLRFLLLCFSRFAASLERTCAAIDGTGCFRLLVACSSFSSSHRGWGGAKRNRFVLSLTLMQNAKLSSFRWRFFLLNTFRRYGARSRALSLAASQSIIVVTKTRRRRKAPPLFLHSLLSLFAKRRWLRASERATI